MRLHIDNYRAITAQKGILDEEVRKSIGMSEKRFLWLLDNQFAECETLEFIADAIGCQVSEISLPDQTMCNENSIEWYKDSDRATITVSQGRYKSRLKRLEEKNPKECQIIAENKDGSLYAHIPVSWVKINPPKKVSDKQRVIARDNMNALHLKRASVTAD